MQYYSSVVKTVAGGIPIIASGSFSDSTQGSIKNTNSKEDGASESKFEGKQMLLSSFEINIIRYALSLDDTKPEDLDPFFLIDLMALPENYFLGDGPQRYGDLLKYVLNVFSQK